MTISIRQAFNNIKSPQYNKANISVYYLLWAIFVIVGYIGICLIASNVYYAQGLVTLLFSLLIYFIIGGMYFIAFNNAINREIGVSPDILSDFKKIIFKGFSGTFGLILSQFIIYLPIRIFEYCIKHVHFSLITKTVMLLLVIVFLIYAAILSIGIFLNYVQSLKFHDWFRFIKGYSFIHKNGNRGGIWILKIILLSILLCIGVAIIWGIIAVLYSNGLNNAKSFMYSIVAIAYIISIIALIISNLCYIDLTAQFIQEVREKNKNLGIMQ